MTEFEQFVLAIDSAIKDGARAEQALRAVVICTAEAIRQRELSQREQASLEKSQ